MLPSLRNFDESETARQRMKIIKFHKTYGEKAAVEAFGADRKVKSRWKKRLKESGGSLESLIPCSTRPKNLRRPKTPDWVVKFVKDLREKHPRLGKEKIKTLLDKHAAKNTLTCSVSDGYGGTASKGINVNTTSGTTTTLPAPALSSPSNAVTGVSTTPTFSWSAVSGADSGYRILVATNASALTSDPTVSTCSGCVINATTTGTSYTPAAGVLSAGTTYYWEVHARSTTMYGAWSSVWNFTTH